MSERLFLLCLVFSLAALTGGSRQVTSCEDVKYGKHCEYNQNKTKWPSCWAYGDPHFRTFDHVTFDFGEKDDFCLVDGCRNMSLTDNLRITAVMKPRKVNETQFRIKAIVIFWGSSVYDIWEDCVLCADLTSDNITWQKVFLPHIDSNEDVWMFKENDNSTVVWLNDTVRISYRDKFHKVRVWINREEFGLSNVCGLCGIFNDIDDDDTDCSINYKAEDGKTQGPANCTVGDLGDQWRAPDLPASLQNYTVPS